MDTTDLTRYILATRAAYEPGATVDQLVQFSALDQMFKDGCDAGTTSMVALQAQLASITDGKALAGRLSGLIVGARNKLRRLGGTTPPSGGGSPTGNPGTPRTRRSKGKER